MHRSDRTSDGDQEDGGRRRDDFKVDEVAINQDEILRNLEHLQQCTFTHKGATRLRETVLNGEIEISLAGLFAMPNFTRSVAERAKRNMRRVNTWIEIAGFVPFTLDVDNETLGEDIVGDPWEPEDDAAAAASEDQPHEKNSVWTSTLDRRAPAFDKIDAIPLTPETGARMSPEMEAEEAMKEKRRHEVNDKPVFNGVLASDFDFMVPSPGLGSFTMYRDCRDNIRKLQYEPPSKGGAGGSTAPKFVPESSRWFVFLVDEPYANGDPNCIVSRLRQKRNELIRAEQLELVGAHLGVKPTVVTEPVAPGKHQGAIDRHSTLLSDPQTIKNVTGKEDHGIDPFYADARSKMVEFYRQVMESAGVDHDHAIGHYVHGTGLKTGSGSTDNPRFLVNEARHYVGQITPHKFMITSEKRSEYISQVAVEYGIPMTDFNAATMRFKLDDGAMNARFTEMARYRRHILCTIMHDIFSIKNGTRLRDSVTDSVGFFTKKASVISLASQRLRGLIETAIHGSIHWKPSTTVADPHQHPEEEEEDEGGGESRRPKKQRTSTAAAAIDSDILKQMLPEKVTDMLHWYQQLRDSLDYVVKMRRVVEDIENADTPVQISWSQPITTDRADVTHAIEVLGFSELRQQDIWRRHYGLIC